jgi:uncharacterized protein YacL
MKKKISFFTLLALIIATYFGYNYIYKDHRDISKEVANYSTTANIIFNEFKTSTTETETKYLNKTIIITGIISEITKTNLTLDNSIFCSFLNSQTNSELNSGKTVKVKGRLIGYDDLLEQVKLDQCTIIN